jgi:hypothetical protein
VETSAAAGSNIPAFKQNITARTAKNFHHVGIF